MEEEIIFDFIIEFYSKYTYGIDSLVKDWGQKIFIMETQHGLPFNISIEKLKDRFSDDIVNMIYIYYTNFLTGHKMLSGISDEKLDKIRQYNIKNTIKMIQFGEIL